MRFNLTTRQAEAIYDILEECCGAMKGMRDECVLYMSAPEKFPNKEFRFGGWLGFGGKLYSNSQDVYVNCYPEHKSPLIMSAIEKANKRIKDLLGS